MVPSNGCFDDVWWSSDYLALFWKEMLCLFCFDASCLERGEDTFPWRKYVWLALDSYQKMEAVLWMFIALICKRQKGESLRWRLEGYGMLMFKGVNIKELLGH